MKVVFDHSREEIENIRTFFFRPERPVKYTAGQYIQLTLAHDAPDSRGLKRWFTLSSSPSEELISITTRMAGENSSSFKQKLSALTKGDSVVISEPLGDFVLPKYIQTPLVFVAVSIGITPFHSMLSWLAATGEKRPIKLIYGVRSEDDIIFQDTFDNANQHATIIVSDPTPAWGGERGHLSAELILGLEQPAPDTLIYISGPEPLVEKLSKDLLKSGTPKRQIVLDLFSGYTT